MEHNKNTFGFDIGIGSCGAAVSNGNSFLYLGSRIFNTANEAKDARLARGSRRNIARKKWRKKQMVQAFIDFNILDININEAFGNGFLCYNTNKEGMPKPKDKTVYHLRARSLNEQISKRELLLCLYNILHARGHFLLETIDFTKDTISFEDYKNLFYDTTEQFITLPDTSKQQFEEDILKKIFAGSLKANEIRSACKNAKFTWEDNHDKDAMTEVLLLIAGYSSKPKTISESFEASGDKITINALKSSDEVNDFFAHCVELYDISNISRILKDHQYLCQAAVSKLDHYDEVVAKFGVNSDEYQKMLEDIKGKASKNGKHYRAVRNLDNSFPNGMYVKEARAILKKQQEYYPEITDEFIEVCESIISARIPYFVGPLGTEGRFKWADKTGNFKYSYSYSMKNGSPINEFETIKAWKERMISHCSYLPEYYALPKGSFIGEVFAIINEINILKAVDENEDAYHLTRKDKVLVFDKLFLTGKKVKFSDISDLLHLKSFGTKGSASKRTSFNNSLSLYPAIVRAIPSLKLDSIEELFANSKKVEEIEDIILAINLYDEEKTKIDYFINEKGLSEDVAKKLGKLKSVSFYSFSKEFIMSQPMNPQKETLMELLFSDNTSKYVNEQMTLITNACDENGVAYDFSANKYEKIIRTNGGKLDINLLIDEGKPIFPISRPVIRSLNETMKMYSEMVRVYGVPDRVVIETARDLKDHTVIKEQPAKSFDKMKSLYEHLIKQIGERKQYETVGVDSWEDIEHYVTKNKTKIELYLRQNGIDLLTGEKINLNNLSDYEVDHILPRGFGDDSMDDKMLISKLANGRKGDRLPLEFIASGEKIGSHYVTASEYINRVESLFEMKLISEAKRKRLLLESSEELDEFINQNLVDTRYIIREFMSILRAYNKVHNYNTHIVSLKAAYTSIYRKAFNLDKAREYGDQHHAHDAALLIIADKTLSHYYPHYDQRKPSGNSSLNTYQTFIKNMMSNDEKEKHDTLTFIKKAFYCAYGVDYTSPNSILEQMKNYVPFYSVKVEKNYTGKFFDATILKKEKYSDDAVLSIVGVNNNKHVFTSVDSAAVDFYKVPGKKKGQREHVAIHIPKVIIDKDGNINKEKYLALIKKHYKKDILINDRGELRTEFFRFRAFKNDLIYNTETNCPTKFNIGSIVNKKLELKFVNMFSYNNIYGFGREVCDNLINHFNLKTRKNKDGVDFSSISTSAFVNHACINLFGIDANDNKIDRAIEMVKDDKNIYELSNHLAYIGLIIDRPGTPPSIDKQYKPVANNDLVAKNPDAEYIKLKYNVLGLRFLTSPNRKIIIQSPKEIQGSYSKIKKEEFTWKIKNDAL